MNTPGMGPEPSLEQYCQDTPDQGHALTSQPLLVKKKDFPPALTQPMREASNSWETLCLPGSTAEAGTCPH